MNYKYIIDLVQRHWGKFLFAGIFLFASLHYEFPSYIAEPLKVASGLLFGIIFDEEYKSKTIEDNRQRERVALIEQFHDLKLLGLKRILPKRDGDSSKNFNFFNRRELHKPRRSLMLIGLTHAALVHDSLRSSLIQFMQKNPRLVISVCFLDPKSPCAPRRSNEVHRDKNKNEREERTRINIEESIVKWKRLREDFPNQISLKKYDAIPYAEYEVTDKDDNAGVIYFIPISYTKHTNDCPSFLFEGKSPLYNFHKEIIETIWTEAAPV